MEAVVDEVCPSLSNPSNGESSSVWSVESVLPVATNVTKPVRAKLPKLEVKRFKGQWQEFWDSFESAIHLNDCLSHVDNSPILRGLVDEPAKSCIAGFTLTLGNYQSSVNILKERYGKKSAIQRAHMQGLLKTERVQDTASLRQRMPCLRSLAMGLKSVLSVWGIIATKTASEWRTPRNVRKFLKSTHVVLNV